MSPDEIRRLAHAFEHSTIGFALQSPQGIWLEVNPAFSHLVGRERDELVGQHFETITHGDDLERSRQQLERLNSGELSSFRFDKRYVHATGREVWVRLDVSMVRDADDRPEFIITQVQDLTASRQIRQALAASEARLASIITAMGEGLVVHEVDGRIVLGNDRAAEILGVDREHLRQVSVGDPRWQIVQPDGSPLPVEENPVIETLRTGAPRHELPLGIDRADGTRVWIELSTEPVTDEEDGSLAAVVATFSDITERRLTEQALRESEERLSLALEGARLGLWDWHLDTGEFGFSAAAGRMLGYRTGDVEPDLETVRELFHADDQETVVERMGNHLRGDSPIFEVDARMRRKAGDYLWVLIRGRVTERADGGSPRRVSGTLMDITQWKRLENRLVQMATTDPLTGLYNRRHTTEELTAEIHRAARTGGTFSLVLLDLDHFKRVNDRLGHDAGDRVLVRVAKLLGQRLRRTDTASRWGGEEFALVLPDTGLDGATRLSRELLEAMAEETDPVAEGLSASFGVVEYLAGESLGDMLKRADRLMYQAKEAGRGRVRAA